MARSYFASGQEYHLVEDLGNGEVLLENEDGAQCYETKVDWDDESIYSPVEGGDSA